MRIRTLNNGIKAEQNIIRFVTCRNQNGDKSRWRGPLSIFEKSQFFPVIRVQNNARNVGKSEANRANDVVSEQQNALDIL